MISILVASLFLLPLEPQDAVKGQPVDAAMNSDQIAVTQLISAFGGGSSSELVSALALAGRIDDTRVIQVSARALEKKDVAVQNAAIEALRFNTHTGAYQVLKGEVSKGFTPEQDQSTRAALVRGMCQKADVTSMQAMQQLKLDTREREVTRAWLLGLGRLRQARSVEVLMSFLEGLPAERRCLYIGDVRTSLVVLTGIDQGLDAEAWLRWWKDVEQAVVVEAFEPKLPPVLRMEWCDYWCLDAEAESQKDVVDGMDSSESVTNEVQALPAAAKKKSRSTPQANSWPNKEESPKKQP